MNSDPGFITKSKSHPGSNTKLQSDSDSHQNTEHLSSTRNSTTKAADFPRSITTAEGDLSGVPAQRPKRSYPVFDLDSLGEDTMSDGNGVSDIQEDMGNIIASLQSAGRDLHEQNRLKLLHLLYAETAPGTKSVGNRRDAESSAGHAVFGENPPVSGESDLTALQTSITAERSNHADSTLNIHTLGTLNKNAAHASNPARYLNVEDSGANIWDEYDPTALEDYVQTLKDVRNALASALASRDDTGDASDDDDDDDDATTLSVTEGLRLLKDLNSLLNSSLRRSYNNTTNAGPRIETPIEYVLYDQGRPRAEVVHTATKQSETLHDTFRVYVKLTVPMAAASDVLQTPGKAASWGHGQGHSQGVGEGQGDLEDTWMADKRSWDTRRQGKA
jgi:hypothetical protein